MLTEPSRGHSRAWALALSAVADAAQTAHSSGGVLPSIDTLVARSGVSRMTLWKALRTFVRDGALRVLPGRRGYAPGRLEAAAVPGHGHEPDGRGGDVYRAIAADITAGHFPSSQQLPSLSALSRRYGACHAVLTAAIRGLAKAGKVERFGRGYRVCGPHQPRSSGCIVVLAHSTRMHDLCAVGTRAADFWRSLELQCHQAAVPVELLAVADDGSVRDTQGRRRRIGCEARPGVPALGHIVLPLGIGGAGRCAVLQFAVSSSLPVALLHEDPWPLALAPRTPRNRLACFLMGFGELPGHIVGNFLYRLGHRRIAMLCHSSRDVAFAARSRGVRTAMGEAGLAQAVSVCTLPRWDDGIEGLEQRAVDNRGREVLARAARSACVSLGVSGRSVLPEQLRHAHQGFVRRSVYEQEARELFAQALRLDEVSAWVAINDELALHALTFLHERGVSVPGRISVVGFDDSVEAFAAGLTSYRFNIDGLVRSMLDHILSPRARVRLELPCEPLELAGTVMPRATTAAFRAHRGPVRPRSS